MKIEQSQVAMAGSRRYVEEHQVRESVRFWADNPLLAENPRPAATAREAARDSVRVSAEARSRLSADKGAAVDQAREAGSRLDPASRLLASMIEAITGRPVEISDFSRLGQSDGEPLPSPPADPAAVPDQPPAEGTPRPAWGMEYERHESYREAEQTRFSAGGVVRTSDGREISFNVDLEMGREFRVQSDVALQAGTPRRKDPLVINFGGTAAELTSQKFSFDIDADGVGDQISFVGTGSGFLLLDKNGDGVATDGSELFGATSGNGFGELARYDEDGNGWIDENDSIYMKLQVWSKDKDGQDHYQSLQQADVGAVFLGNVVTGFALKDGQNQEHGQIRSSGIYLQEDGSAGTVQQIDLTV